MIKRILWISQLVFDILKKTMKGNEMICSAVTMEVLSLCLARVLYIAGDRRTHGLHVETAGGDDLCRPHILTH